VSTDDQGTQCRRKIAENYNRLSRVHERYRRHTDGRQHIANVNASSRSLKADLLRRYGPVKFLIVRRANPWAGRESIRWETGGFKAGKSEGVSDDESAEPYRRRRC